MKFLRMTLNEAPGQVESAHARLLYRCDNCCCAGQPVCGVSRLGARLQPPMKLRSNPEKTVERTAHCIPIPSAFRRCFIPSSIILATFGAACVELLFAAPSGDGPAFFEAKIRPLFIEHCQKCHGGSKQESGLRLDSKAGWQKGGKHGAVIVPGDPDKSLLIQAVRRKDKSLQMPPKRALGAEDVAALEQWVKLGAPGPREGVTVAKAGVDAAAARKHWAFQPVAHPQPPVVKGKALSQQPLDRFVLARMQQQGLSPNPTADRRTLIRRATFDLTGLPPTLAEIEVFLNDQSSTADAFAKLVDRQLASPAYGERWGRHWLDVARYADTAGDGADYPVREA